MGAQTYHSFFQWSGQKEWSPEPGKNGMEVHPRVIIWDVVCTVPRPILETFLECVWHNADYYEEVEIDYRAKDEKNPQNVHSPQARQSPMSRDKTRKPS